MSVGFGFSAGDFIAALNLVSEVVDSLRDSGESSAEYRQLLRLLLDLETALIQVKRLELPDSQIDQYNALRHAALQCRNTVDEFMAKIQKYQPHLQNHVFQSKAATIKRSWYKVKWAVCRKDDLTKFKADIMGHTEAINILLNAIQLEQLTLETKRHDQRHSNLKLIIQACYVKTMQKLNDVSDTLQTAVSNSKRLLEITAETTYVNCRIFTIVLDIQQMFRNTIAPQILRDQPVYFIDALGIPGAFYLDFIRSREAFIAVLESNMKGRKVALRRIQNGDFAISDTTTKDDIDLSQPWSTCFRPGQRVNMSMIVDHNDSSTGRCPSCKTDNRSNGNGDCSSEVECQNCGLWYEQRTSSMHNPVSYTGPAVDHVLESSGLPRKRKRASDNDEDEGDAATELVLYRRVRLRRIMQYQKQPRSDSSTQQEPHPSQACPMPFPVLRARREPHHVVQDNRKLPTRTATQLESARKTSAPKLGLGTLGSWTAHNTNGANRQRHLLEEIWQETSNAPSSPIVHNFRSLDPYQMQFSKRPDKHDRARFLVRTDNHRGSRWT